MNNADWWAKRITPQAPTTQPRPQQFVVPIQQMPQQPQPEPQRLPASATNNARCPGCGSGNYGGATPESRPRCYDCGYPLTQTGTGMPGVNTPASGPAQASRQIANGGWNPTTIVDRIG